MEDEDLFDNARWEEGALPPPFPASGEARTPSQDAPRGRVGCGDAAQLLVLTMGPPGFQMGAPGFPAATREAAHHSTRADWHEWMRRLSIEMLRQSPSAALRACAPLAELYQPLARELFNAGVLSCWSDGSGGVDGYKKSLTAALEVALDTENMSVEVLQPLLNLAEFMELADRPLPIDIRKLGALAEKCHAYAKALHYREIEFAEARDPAGTVEALISINNHLQQPEAAKGILTHARQAFNIALKESWYEALQRWEDARLAYERKEREDPANLAWTVGRMRCHHALGDWATLGALVKETWHAERLQEDGRARSEVARLAAVAAWNLHDWHGMAEYASQMPNGSVETSLVRAVLAVHAGDGGRAQVHIDDARTLLDSEFTALVGESYHRAYRPMIHLLQLAELEEIVTHQTDPEAMPRALLEETWRERIEHVQRDADVWQGILAVRYLVVPPSRDPATWIKFCSLCRKAGRSALSRELLGRLLQPPEPPAAASIGGRRRRRGARPLARRRWRRRRRRRVRRRRLPQRTAGGDVCVPEAAVDRRRARRRRREDAGLCTARGGARGARGGRRHEQRRRRRRRPGGRIGAAVVVVVGGGQGARGKGVAQAG